jgi:KipI family sensor histidine kinase inhibitor
MIELRPLGDRAYLARFPSETEARSWVEAVRAARWPGVVEVALAYATAAVYADPGLVDLTELESRLRKIEPNTEATRPGKLVRIPVLYDGEDLAEVAVMLNLTTQDVIRCHSGRDYDVFAIGFLPGFPYAGYLDAPLARLPRRSPPRVRVPAGSVAVAARQTGIYPTDCPGGWHLLGRTPCRIVNVAAGFFPIRPGDQIRFEPIDRAEFEARRGQPLDPAATPELEKTNPTAAPEFSAEARTR